MNQINKILSELGLSPSETDVYLALLELGEASVQEVGHKSKLPRTTTASILDRLQLRGLVSIQHKSSKRIYWVETPRSLSENYRAKALLAEQLNQKVASMYRQADKKPHVEIFDNEKAIINLINKTINSLPKGSEILTWDSPLAANYLNIMSEEMFSILSDKKISKGVQTRSLIPYGQSEYVNKKNLKPSVKVRVAPEGLGFSSSTWVFNDCLVLFSGIHVFAVCITNKNINHDFKSTFEYLWQRSTPLQEK